MGDICLSNPRDDSQQSLCTGQVGVLYAKSLQKIVLKVACANGALECSAPTVLCDSLCRPSRFTPFPRSCHSPKHESCILFVIVLLYASSFDSCSSCSAARFVIWLAISGPTTCSLVWSPRVCGPWMRQRTGAWAPLCIVSRLLSHGAATTWKPEKTSHFVSKLLSKFNTVGWSKTTNCIFLSGCVRLHAVPFFSLSNWETGASEMRDRARDWSEQGARLCLSLAPVSQLLWTSKERHCVQSMVAYERGRGNYAILFGAWMNMNSFIQESCKITETRKPQSLWGPWSGHVAPVGVLEHPTLIRCFRLDSFQFERPNPRRRVRLVQPGGFGRHDV